MAGSIRIANEAWESLMTAHTVLLRSFAEESIWREHGITMREYDVLYTLAKCDGRAAAGHGAAPGATRIGDLRDRVLLSQPALSRMVDRLAERGLVERLPDETDRRAVRVRLTDAGAELQRAVGRAHARSVGRSVSGTLTEAEMRELKRLGEKMIGGRAGDAATPNEPHAEAGER